jgi:hypothetical protein
MTDSPRSSCSRPASNAAAMHLLTVGDRYLFFWADPRRDGWRHRVV